MEEMLARMPGMRSSIVQDWFELDPKKTVQQGQVWRLVTSQFATTVTRSGTFCGTCCSCAGSGQH